MMFLTSTDIVTRMRFMRHVADIVGDFCPMPQTINLETMTLFLSDEPDMIDGISDFQAWVTYLDGNPWESGDVEVTTHRLGRHTVKAACGYYGVLQVNLSTILPEGI